MMQDGDFGHAQDKTDQSNNQKPKGTFEDSQEHAGAQNGRHDQINKNSQEYIHQARSLRHRPPQASTVFGGHVTKYLS
jgi:hypothetical protein